jgi:hypothetical protein
MKKEIKYKTDPTGYSIVYCGKTIIAQAYIEPQGERAYSVRILQGMPRDETIKKICADCPEFAKANEIDENYYPKLFSK